MQTISLDPSRLYGFRILQAGALEQKLDARVGGKIGIPKTPASRLDSRLGAKAGMPKAPGEGLDGRLGAKIGQSKIDR